MPESVLTRKELTVIACTAVFALIWSIFVMTTFMGSEWFAQQLPPVQFFLFDIGYFVLFVAVLGLPISYLTSKGRRNRGKELWTAIKVGLSVWIGISVIYDLFEPPFYIGANGQILLNNSQAMTGTAVDATIAWIWQAVGVQGTALYYCVYLVTPVVLIVLVALLFTWKKFIKMFEG